MTSDFLSLISHGWVVPFQDSLHTVFTFRSWLDLLGVVLAFWISILKISKLLQNCWHRVIDITSFEKHLESSTSVFDFHSKNLQITSKLLTQSYRYHKLRKKFGKFFRSYSELLSKFCDISSQEYLSKGISHPVFNGDLVYKLRRVKDTPNFILSGSKIVNRLRRRQYEPMIIERTIGLVLGPFTALNRLFLKHCTLTNKAVGTIMTGLVQTSSEETGSWSLSPLIVSRDSFSHHTWARFQPGGAQPALFGCRWIYFLIYNIHYLCCLCIDFMTSPLGVAVGFVLYIRRFIYKFLNVCPFDFTAVAVSGKVGP